MKTANFRFLFGILSLALFVLGCEPKVPSALQTDATGYQCSQCKLKFYTDTDVYAEFCPGCKTGAASRVAGLICPKDQHITIPTGNSATVVCEKCGAPVDAVKPLQEAELKAWGAVKKTRAEVTSSQ